MSNYIENIKVGTGAPWPVRDAEAHALLNTFAVDLNNHNELINECFDAIHGRGLAAFGPLTSLWNGVDNMLYPGWYVFNDPINISGHEFDGGGMRIDMASPTSTIQTLYPNDDSMAELKRRKINGVWSPWEWVNPPMELGYEYRTTERFMGKPVYRKAVELGRISEDDITEWAMDSELDIFNMGSCVEVSLVCDTGENITHYEEIESIIATSGALIVRSITEFDGVIAYLRYTKTELDGDL